MNEDLDELVLERAAEVRMNRNQKIRAQMIDALGGTEEEAKGTAKDPKLAYILLAALKDSDSIDIKRLGLKQNEKEIDNRARVLSFMENITNQVKGNPYRVEGSKANAEIKNRPMTFYEKDDFVEGELEIGTNLTNYQDFMRSRNAIPSSENRSDNDSAS